MRRPRRGRGRSPRRSPTRCALDWPRERLEVVVCSDGSDDDTVARARAAGADLVLELPRVGKVRAQDAGVEAARGELLAFSDANSTWEPDALAALAAAFDDPRGRLRLRPDALRAGRRRAPAPTTRRGSTGATRWRCAPPSRGCAR